MAKSLDRERVTELYEQWTPWIKRCTTTFYERNTNHGDLIWDDVYAAACEGFIYALTKWDPAKGKVGTYATPWMIQRMQKEAHRHRPAGWLGGCSIENLRHHDRNVRMLYFNTAYGNKYEEGSHDKAAKDGDAITEDHACDLRLKTNESAFNTAHFNEVIKKALKGVDKKTKRMFWDRFTGEGSDKDLAKKYKTSVFMVRKKMSEILQRVKEISDD